MTSPRSPQDDNTYFIDPQSAAEMARLTELDRIITTSMGGLFPERTEITNIHSVLDIACGPGGWALEVAFQHPEIQVMGIDINHNSINYANAQARVQQLKNVSFRAMNAVEALDFPDGSFDLVNARSILSFMPRTGWASFLQECKRITRPGGTIRLTEGEWGICNQPATARFLGLLAQALHRAGHTFSPDGRHFGLVQMIGRFLKDAGCENIQRMPHILDASAGMEAYEASYQDVKIFSRLIQPFLVKVGITTQEEIEKLYEQSMLELLSPDYCSVTFYLTVWGTTPV